MVLCVKTAGTFELHDFCKRLQLKSCDLRETGELYTLSVDLPRSLCCCSLNKHLATQSQQML